MTAKHLVITILSFSIGLPIFAQDHGSQAAREQLIALDSLVGQWEGEGYIIDQQSREKRTFAQKENIYYDLDSTIIMVEGKGVSGDEIVHNARAIISPSEKADQFEFYSFLADGKKGKFIMIKNDKEINWFIDLPQGKIKYTITLKGDEYHEIGQFGSADEWYPFMEMHLKRIK